MMGTFRVQIRVFNWDESERTRGLEALVDTGASRSVIPADVVAELGIQPERAKEFTLADGRKITRWLGWVGIEYKGESVHSHVVLGESSDPAILGALTLEDLALQVDPVRGVLRPAEEFLLGVA